MMLAYLKALVDKRLAENAPAPPVTQTPLPDLKQGSLVEINEVPLIVAGAAGSLVKNDFGGAQIVTAIGKLSFMGLDFYRAYLGDNGNFFHLAVSQRQPNTVLEGRVYQPYLEIVPTTPDELAFWMFDDPSPDRGGMIGCPVMQSKDEDGKKPYRRTWGVGDQRVPPIQVHEYILDRTGQTTTLRHSLMHYSRPLDDGRTKEHMLVSMVETPTTASVNLWLGLDIEKSEVKISAVS